MIWDPSPEIVSLGPLSLRWYGVLFATGFLLGYRIVRRMFELERWNTALLDSLLSVLVIGTVVGARLGHCLLYEPEIYLRDPIRILKIWEGGLASHGGGLGVILALWWFARRHFGGRTMLLLDRICIPTALTGAMIRLGNFFNSEIIGRPTDAAWGVVFKRVDPLPRHPAQLYESIAYFVTFAVLMALFRRPAARARSGLIFGLFLILTFVARIVIEFFKEHQVSFESSLPFGLDMGQLLSVPFLIAGCVLVARALRAAPSVPAAPLESPPRKAPKRKRDAQN